MPPYETLGCFQRYVWSGLVHSEGKHERQSDCFNERQAFTVATGTKIKMLTKTRLKSFTWKGNKNNTNNNTTSTNNNNNYKINKQTNKPGIQLQKF